MKTLGICKLNIQFVLYFNLACKMLAEIQLMDRKKKSIFYQYRITGRTWKNSFLKLLKMKAEGNYSLQNLRRELILQKHQENTLMHV